MAFEYQGFATLGVNLNRQKYGPLDISNVFTSENDFKYYLTKGAHTEGVSTYWYESADKKVVPYPYEGQVLATVIDGIVKVYVLSLNAEGNFQAKAIEPDVDGTTIVKNANGELAIVAPENADASKSYNFSYANGVYSWVEVDTATAAGQAQAIAGLAERTTAVENRAAAVEATLNGTEDADGLVDKVAGHAADIAALETAIADALAEAKDYADDQDEATAYDDTAVVGRIATLEAASEDHESRIAEVEKFFELADGETIDDALNTLAEIQREIATDNESAAAMLSSIGANTTAIETLNGDATKAGSVAKKIADAIAAENLGQYATNEALEGLSDTVAEIEESLDTFATKDDISGVNEELAKKIESATIAHSTEDKSEGVTLNGTELNIVVDAYTKAETLAQIEEILDQINDNSESANSVNTKLENHLKAYTEKVGQIDAKDAAQDTAIATAQAQADKGVEDAAAVAAALATANSTIADNTREIGVAKGLISDVNTTLTEKITALEGKDATVEGNITALQTTVSGHTTTITEHGTKLAALESKDAELAALIQGNTDKFGGYYTKSEVDAAVQTAIDAIPEVDFEPYATIAKVDADILGVYEEIAKKANAADVYTTAAADAKFMTQDQVDARVNALIDGANNEDTIKNVTNLVEFVNNNAGDIATLVTDVAANKAAHEANATAIGKNAEDIAALNTAVAAMVQPKESAEISVADDGVIAIKELNVNKLVQTEGDVLILQGGSATV